MMLLVVGMLPLSAEEAVAPEKKVIDGVIYHIITVDPQRIQIVWKGADDKPLRTFPEAVKYFEGKGTRILGPTRIGAHGTPIFFLHPKDMEGVLTEIMESPKGAH